MGFIAANLPGSSFANLRVAPGTSGMAVHVSPPSRPARHCALNSRHKGLIYHPLEFKRRFWFSRAALGCRMPFGGKYNLSMVLPLSDGGPGCGYCGNPS